MLDQHPDATTSCEVGSGRHGHGCDQCRVQRRGLTRQERNLHISQCAAHRPQPGTVRAVTSPEDESLSDSAWREIVENYGERPALFAREPLTVAPDVDADPEPEPDPPPSLDDDQSQGNLFEALTRVEHFHPPVPPPIPRPRTWQRAAAWAGLTVAPVLALIASLTSTYLPPPIGWILLLWPIAGFLYLVFDMPTNSREPWDDGSRI